jgi:hypothetical protein
MLTPMPALQLIATALIITLIAWGAFGYFVMPYLIALESDE